MAEQRTFPQLLRQLGAALLNATLLLAIILVVSIFLLLGRIQGFATETATAAREALIPEAEHLERIATAAEAIEAQLENGAANPELAAEIVALRADLAAIRERVATTETPDDLAASIFALIFATILGGEDLPPQN